MLQRLRRGDDGLGMVLVIGTAGIVTSLMILATTTASRSLTSSREHVSFESAIAATEAGIDAALARAQKVYDATGMDTYAIPSATDPTCAGTAVAWPFTAVPTPEQERSWARTQLVAMATTPSCLQSSKSGDFVFFKPVGHQAVYAMGWAPRYGAAEVKQRMVKAEYLFAPYSPTNAILTSGNLELESSTRVTTAPPADPTLATVHANGNVVVTNGNPTVEGQVSQSGTGATATSNNFVANPSGTVAVTNRKTIPTVSALQVWGRQRGSNPPGGWYDLCPDGTARVPGLSDTAPCQGAVQGTGSFRGWVFDGSGSVPRWTATSAVKTSDYSGTYYVQGGDAVADASNTGSAVSNLTVIAAASTISCNKVGGNVDWNLVDMAAPSIPNLFMLADQDLRTGSNFYAGSASNGTVVSGFFIAGDQVQMQTSSAGAYGAVIAADQCDPANGTSLVDSNVIKNPAIYFDPNGQAPFIDIVNTTLWLELPG